MDLVKIFDDGDGETASAQEQKTSMMIGWHRWDGVVYYWESL